MAFAAKGSPPGHGRDPLELSSYGCVGLQANIPNEAPAQAEILRNPRAVRETAEAAFAAERALAEAEAAFAVDIALTLTASGWRSTAYLLVHAANCIEAGDFLGAERNRKRARDQFVEATDAFRQFQEERAAAAAWIGAEAFLRPPP